MGTTLAQVEDALDSYPQPHGVLVVEVQEDGTLKRLAQRDAVRGYPGHIVPFGSKAAFAAFLERPSQGVSRPSQPVDPASPGDQPTANEPPRGPGE